MKIISEFITNLLYPQTTKIAELPASQFFMYRGMNRDGFAGLREWGKR